MRKLLILMLLSFSIGVFAQNAPIDFEAGGNGATWTWSVFENDTNPPLEIIANPDPTGNTSSTVAKFTAVQAGQPFAGVESMKGADIGTFTLDNTNSLIKIWVWKPVISDVGIKLVRPDFGALPEVKVANTVVNQWEELTFDFTGQEGFTYDQIVVFPDFNARTQSNVCYFDNITFNAQPVPTAPTTAAPTPTAPASKVISLFSNAYTDVTVDTWNASFSNATLADIQIAGDDTKLYTNLDFVGVETVGPNLVDASSTNTFNLDIWTPNATTFRVKLVDFGADLSFGGGDDSEFEIPFTGFPQNEWVTLSIPLSDFTGLTSTTNIAQYIFSAIPVGGATVYVDNVYFSQEAVVGPNVPIDFEAGGNGADWTWTVFENDTNPPLQIIPNPDPTGNTSATVAAFTATQAGQPFAGVESMKGSDIGLFTLDNTNSLIKIWVWKPVISDVGIKLVRPDFGALPEVKVPNTVVNQWEELTFDFSGQEGFDYDQIVVFPDFNARTQSNVCYFDNVSLNSQIVVGPNVPIDFEAGGNGADWTWTVFENDTNPPLQIIPNPDPTGNTSATVAEFTALQAGQPFAGVESMKGSDIGQFTLDNTNSLIKIWVWKPVISDVGIKLVRPDFAALPEVKVANTVVNQWEELTFDFSGQEGFVYDQIVIFPDFDARTQTNVCYFDNISLNQQVVLGPNVPIDFEAGGNGADWTWTVFENDTNPPLQIIPNPDPTGNTSATVAEFTALQAGQPFAGVESMKGSDIGQFTLDNTNSLIKIWVWKPVISDVGIKLVRPDFAALPEVKVANTVVNQWEELTFDFSGQEGFVYDQIVIFPDFDARTQTNVCYFDNISLNQQVVLGPNVPIDFEAGGNGADWTWTVFENDTNPPLQIIPNPDPTGNTSATVAEFTALQAGQPFAGVESMKGSDIGQFTLDNTNSLIKIWVWKPVISDVGIKLVRPDFAALPEVKVANTVVNQWEELTFDFSGQEGFVYDQIVIFPDFDARTQTNVCYFDNISLNQQVVLGPNVPIDFEAGGNGADWTWTVFENDTNPPLQIIPNPDPTGNTSATVAEFTALQAGQPFAGVESMKGSDIGQFTLDNTNSLIKIWVWKPVISDVGIKLVRPDFAALPEVKVANTVVNQWEELTFDFSGQEGFVYDQIVIFPDFDARTQTNVCYFDNISLNPQVTCPVPTGLTSTVTDDDVVLSWNPVPGAASYVIRGNAVGSTSPVSIPVGGGATSYTVNDLAQNDYTWTVKAVCSTNPLDESEFAAPAFFTIAAPAFCPTPMSPMTSVSGSSATISWNQSNNSIGYYVVGGPVSNPDAEEIIINDPNTTSVTVNNLAPGAYTWKVRSGCAVNPFVLSPFTASQMFTIVSSSAKYSSSLFGDVGIGSLNVQMFPNPATNQVNFIVKNINDEAVTIELLDMSGRRMEMNTTVAGNNQTITINTSNLSNGIYQAVITSGTATKVERLIIAQ